MSSGKNCKSSSIVNMYSPCAYLKPQSNALLLTSMLYEFATNIRADAILFEEDRTTNLSVSEVVFRSKQEFENTFGKKVEDGSGYVLEKGRFRRFSIAL